MKTHPRDMDRPVFVVGAPRSGTTLMARILGRHSRVFMPGEVHFFDDVYARREELGDPADPEAAARIHARLMGLFGRYNEPADQARVDELARSSLSLASMRDACRSWPDVLRWFMAAQARREGKPRFGNQAPRDLFNAADVLRFFPQAQLVIMVRDPRDFMLSYSGKWRVSDGENAERLRRLYHPVLAALQWRACMRQAQAVLDRLPEAQRIAVRYEDLAAEPEAVARRVCAAIGEDFEEGMLEVGSYGSSDPEQAGAAGVFTSSVGRWRHGLPAEDAWMAQALCREQMQGWGYPVEDPKASWSGKMKTLASAPWGAVRAFRANRGKRGPLWPYLRRRLFPSAAGPAARGEVRGFDVFRLHRFGRRFRRWPLLPRLFEALIFLLFNSSIPLECKIGEGVRAGHRGVALVINKDAVIGPRCLIRPHVVIGGGGPVAGAPTLGADVEVGAGAKILGGVRVGEGARIGANAVVVSDVPAGALAVGVPAKVRDG